jgi:hypothetical protein
MIGFILMGVVYGFIYFGIGMLIINWIHKK